MIPVALNVGNPLPRADPLFRPMHRTCLDRGCQHRGRLVTYSGWILALIFTGPFVLMVYAHRGLLQIWTGTGASLRFWARGAIFRVGFYPPRRTGCNFRGYVKHPT